MNFINLEVNNMKKLLFGILMVLCVFLFSQEIIIQENVNDDYTNILMGSNVVYRGLNEAVVAPLDTEIIYLDITASDTLRTWYIQGGAVYSNITIKGWQSVVNTSDTYTFIEYITNIWIFGGQTSLITPFDAGMGTLWNSGYPLVRVKFKLYNPSETDTAYVYTNVQLRSAVK